MYIWRVNFVWGSRTHDPPPTTQDPRSTHDVPLLKLPSSFRLYLRVAVLLNCVAVFFPWSIQHVNLICISERSQKVLLKRGVKFLWAVHFKLITYPLVKLVLICLLMPTNLYLQAAFLNGKPRDLWRLQLRPVFVRPYARWEIKYTN